MDPRKFGRIYLFLGRDALDAFLDERLGPEPLEIERGELDRLLEQRRGRLKSLLLDQRFLAGIGNLYADEILWESRLHPERSVESLTARERGRLHQAIQQVLSTAIERRGTSLSDYVDAEGEQGTNQNYLRVYGRAGPAVSARGVWPTRSCARSWPSAAPGSALAASP